ncbi:hypothetical protein Sango_3086000 [Sesamum angolense]|uniref:Reverse transcriptase domain-containing protein n=1 Tax=Sesamum angolense TaxID=2727404 RepID=A0AAE1T9R5_9LAMI|nr:hypothetical protein Sango_3086000 [Sesamum angolense]
MGKIEVNDSPRKGVIRMIVGGPIGRLTRARKTQIRETYGTVAREVMDVEPANDAPLIQFDSGSSADILFGEAYDQMQLGDLPLEAVDTSLYGFAGEIKFPVIGGVGEAHADVLQARKCMSKPSGKERKEGDPRKVTKIGSKMTEDIRNQVVNCLRRNKDIFAWTPQDLEGINPNVITHHLNLDPNIRPAENEGAAYQKLVDKIFYPKLGRKMEVYVDDMLVKNKEGQQRTFPGIHSDLTRYRGLTNQDQGYPRYGTPTNINRKTGRPQKSPLCKTDT